MAASFVCADRVPWSLARVPRIFCDHNVIFGDGDGVPGDGGGFALSDFALVGEGLQGLCAVRGAWSLVQASDEHLEGSEHALSDVVEAFFVFAPELEVAGFAASVGEDGEWDEGWGEGEACDGDDGVTGAFGVL